MIKSLRIQNFQNHRDSFIEFAPGLTAITGHNGNGKSAIFRALMKVIRNTPTGQFFIRDGTSKCVLDLITDNTKVTRAVHKGTSSKANAYVINDEEEYVKFGVNVPTAVSEALGVSPEIKFGDTPLDLNFQVQLKDQPFLVFGQGIASLRGKVLSKVTGVDTIQRAIQVTGNLERRKESLAEQRRAEVQTDLANIKRFEYLERIRLDYVQIQELQDSIAQKQNLLTELRESLAQLQTAAQQARDLKSFIGRSRQIQSSALGAIRDRLDIASILIDAYNVQYQQGIQKRVLQSHAVIDISRAEVFIDLQYTYLDLERVHRQRGVQQRFVQECTMIDVNPVRSKVELQQQYLETVRIYSSYQATQRLIAMSDLPDSKIAVRLIHNFGDIVQTYSESVGCSTELEQQQAVCMKLRNEESTVTEEMEQLKAQLQVCPTCGKPL